MKIFKFLTVFLFSIICMAGAIEAADSQEMYILRSRTILHTEPDNESPTIELPYMTRLDNYGAVTDSDKGSWVKVGYSNEIYYIWTDKGVDYFTDAKSSYKYIGNNKYQQDVLDKALYINNNWDTKYEHGQSTGIPDSDGKYGFDCSGFANYVLGTVMREYIPAYRLSSNIEKLYNWGAIYNIGMENEFLATTVMSKTLDKSLLAPGDVIFFMLGDDPAEVERGYDHCGIYLGNNEFIHSTTAFGGGVCIMPLSDIYVDGFVCVKRYIPYSAAAINESRYTASVNNRIYAEMDTSLEPITILDAEVKVELLYTNDTWAYIKYGDEKEGYILLTNLTEKIEDVSETRYIAKTSLRLYKENTTGSDYVEVLIGTPVEYKGRYAGSNYYKVVYEGNKYFVYAPNGPDERLCKDYDRLMSGIGTVTVAENTNLRSTLSTENSENIIYKVSAGDKFTLIARSDSGTWCFVKDDAGQCGFLLSDKLEIKIDILKGDVNDDKIVDASDALLALKYAAKLSELTENQKAAGDMNEDDVIDASDALTILKIAAKLL